ncbi:MAG: 1,4-dihydroxy-2-naphthoyl-CoA hydrolase [Paracoccaceae bacterium]|jgi:1,4-dihydroxy-2-naphthoyl-CoA hydrolase
MTKTYHGAIAFSIDEVTPDRATGTMPIGPGILNPFGTVHAGAMTWFADVVATSLALSGAEVSEGMPNFQVAVTLNANLLSNRKDGVFTATAAWIKKGRRISTIRTEVTDPSGAVMMELTSTHVSAR